MTFTREKRLLLGLVALGVAWPLPLSDALEWPVLAAFLVAVVLFLRRAWRGSERWLSNRALNLLGLAYLPVLVLDVLASGRVQPVRPVLHLTLFGVAAKLWSLTREKDKWQTWIGLFFLFLAAMATSTHPSVVAYLVAFLALTLVLLARFVQFHVLSAYGAARGAPPGARSGWMVAAMVVATIVLAVPLFALLPRVRTPFVGGPGVLGGEPSRRMGFTDDINLDLIGRLRENREVALRVRLEGRTPQPATIRFKAGAYEAWAGRTWRQAPGARPLRKEAREGLFRLAPGAPVGRARIALEPLRSPSLPLPLETLAVDAAALRLELSDGGALSLGGLPGQVYEYEALLGPAPVSLAPPPEGGPEAGPRSTEGVSAPMVELAAAWAGAGGPGARARNIEQRLRADYAYTTEFVGRGGAAPIEDFLFRDRRGHCEYFASAMVLLLRTQGIPARLVTGFYGAEWSAWDGAWLVRQSNAHVWVEAWLPETGWTTFDPTPADGLPRPGAGGPLASLREAWDALVFRWDRWVISYDFEDQVGVLGAVRSWWSDLMRRMKGERRAEGSAAAPASPAASGAPEPDAGGRARRWPWLAAALAVAAVGAWRLLARRAAWTAARAYLLLRTTLGAAGLPVPDSLAPLALERLVALRLPAASPAASRLIGVYLEETFAGRPPAAAELARLRGDLTAVERAARAARRALRRQA